MRVAENNHGESVFGGRRSRDDSGMSLGVTAATAFHFLLGGELSLRVDEPFGERHRCIRV